MGGFGGGELEQPRQWWGAQWAGLFLGVPSCPEPPGALKRHRHELSSEEAPPRGRQEAPPRGRVDRDDCAAARGEHV